MRALIEASERLDLPLTFAGVVADRPCGAVEFVELRGAPAQVVDYSRSEPGALRDALSSMTPDCVVTNIHKVIDAETLKRHPGKFVNLHYSLLPAFAGLIGMSTVDAAREHGARVIGGTCHEVTDALDGGPILGQAATAIDWADSDGIEDVVFRLSSLAFLNALLLKYGHHRGVNVDTLEIADRLVLFSPELDERLLDLDENFWSAVANNG